MSCYEEIVLANSAHADAGTLTAQLFHIAQAVERNEDCGARYARVLQLYGDLGQRIAGLAQIVSPKVAAQLDAAITGTETVI